MYKDGSSSYQEREMNSDQNINFLQNNPVGI